MDISIDYLSFFIIQDQDEEQAPKITRHFQTLNGEEYEESELKPFLNNEFKRIVKRKAERYPNTEQPPTKIGRFIVEPGHELTSNPNYNQFMRLMNAQSKDDYITASDDVVRIYTETSAVRSGAFFVTRAKLPKYFDEPFIFLMKCDFEQHIARIADEKQLISKVEMAISARNMKSIQYPHMPEIGMREEAELKIHQSSHARYFEDFLKFVTYEKSMPEIIHEQMGSMVQQYMDEKWTKAEDAEERQKEEESFEMWALSENRELQNKWTQEKVMEAAQYFVAQKEDLDLSFQLDNIKVKGLLSQFGDQIHIAQFKGRYVVLLEGDAFQFNKSISPIELLQPEDLHEVLNRIEQRPEVQHDEVAATIEVEESSAESTSNSITSNKDDAPPW